jgi:transcriptional regulator with XRE-family HTH domain
MGKNKKIIDIDNEFGGRLRNLRKQHGLSQDLLAEKLGYQTGVSVSNIEAGKSPIDANKLYQLAKILKADLHALITGEPSPTVIRLVDSFRPQIEARFKQLQDERDQLHRQLVNLELAHKFSGDDNAKQIDQAKNNITKIDTEQQTLMQILADIFERKNDKTKKP